jgi:hypothetical protein
MSIRGWIQQQLTIAVERPLLELHCAHTPVGSCGRLSCDAQVEADRFN